MYYNQAMWQDKVIAICQIGAIIALQPIIFGKYKPTFLTSAMNFTFAGIISVTLYTLHLRFAMTTAGLISISWLIIGVQKLRQKA